MSLIVIPRKSGRFSQLFFSPAHLWRTGQDFRFRVTAISLDDLAVQPLQRRVDPGPVVRTRLDICHLKLFGVGFGLRCLVNPVALIERDTEQAVIVAEDQITWQISRMELNASPPPECAM